MGFRKLPSGTIKFEGIKTAVVEGDIILYEAPEHIEHSRPANGQRGVKISRNLAASAGKIDFSLARVLIHGDADFDGTAMIRGKFERSVWQSHPVRDGPTRRHYL